MAEIDPTDIAPGIHNPMLTIITTRVVPGLLEGCREETLPATDDTRGGKVRTFTRMEGDRVSFALTETTLSTKGLIRKIGYGNSVVERKVVINPGQENETNLRLVNSRIIQSQKEVDNHMVIEPASQGEVELLVDTLMPHWSEARGRLRPDEG